jgi:PAS domain S-box-containing protein
MRFDKAITLIGTIPKQAKLALDLQGVAWASTAGIIGLVCCAVSFVVITTSLNTADIDSRRVEAEETAALAENYRTLMRSIQPAKFLAAEGGSGRRAVMSAWTDFNDHLTRACTSDDKLSSIPELLAPICAARLDFRNLVLPELEVFNPPARRLTPEVEQAMLATARDIHDATKAAAGNAGKLAAGMANSYRTAIFVLTLSTTGFVAAGLVLIFLVGRGSMLHFEQWRIATTAATTAAESRDLLNETIEALPAGVVLYDAEERLMLFNSLAASIAPSLKRPGAIGMTHGALVHEAGKLRDETGLDPNADWIADQITRFRSKGARGLRQSPDGRWFEWSEKSTPAGRTVGLRVDVTERRIRELEIAHARDQYQALVDSLSDVVFAVDTKGKLTFAGGGAVALFGVPPCQLVGTQFKDYVDPGDWIRVRDAGSSVRASQGDDVCQTEFLLVPATGERRHVEVRFRNTLTFPGEGSVLAGVIRDIEDRRQLSRRLDGEMRRLRSIVESSGALIVMVDRDLQIVMVNSGFTAVAGVTERDAIGRPLKEVINCPLGESVLRQWLDPSIDSRDHRPVQFSNSIVDPAGRPRSISVTATPVHDEAGIMRSIVFVGVDDTARRETELQLIDAERLKGIGEMAATMAHEVNQPLQVILLAAEIAGEDISEAIANGTVVDIGSVQEKLARIVTYIERASRLVQGLRAHARNTTAEEATEFDIGLAVRGAVDLTDHLVRQGGAILAVAVPIALPPVRGHITRLEQVLINLINNARDSLTELNDESREKLISVFANTTMRDGRELVLLAVEDTGAGLADHILRNLFMPFMTTKPRGKGTGLGLPLCRRIIEEMGGTITAENRPHGGARFEILLPTVARPARPTLMARVEQKVG